MIFEPRRVGSQEDGQNSVTRLPRMGNG